MAAVNELPSLAMTVLHNATAAAPIAALAHFAGKSQRL
jgi:hypothetical protein